MPEIIYKLTINAAPAKVFDALTDPKHIARWWTPDCTADQKEGGRARFEFKNSDGKLDGYSVMRIEKLVPNERVEWKCLEQDYQGIQDWVGTSIRFSLSPNQQGTDLAFVHSGFASTEGSYHRCTDGWGHVLTISLKNYLETGKGEPYLVQVEKEAEQLAGK